MPTFVGMTDGVNRRVCINAGWYQFGFKTKSILVGRRHADFAPGSDARTLQSRHRARHAAVRTTQDHHADVIANPMIRPVSSLCPSVTNLRGPLWFSGFLRE
jgi:hypothetical protein